MKNFFLRSIGIGILVYLLGWVVDTAELETVLRHFNLGALLYILPFYFALWTIRVFRWQLLLTSENIHLPFWDVMALSASGFYLGALTPGRVGEFAKVNFLMNAGHSFRGAFMSSLWERFFDIAALFVYVLFAILICWKALPDTLIFYSILTAIAAAGLGAAYALRRQIRNAILRAIPESIAGNVEEKFNILSRSLNALRGNRIWILFGYTLAMWGLNHFMIYLLFRGVGYSISILFSFAFSTIGSLAALVPVSIYGVGVRESMMIGMFSLVGYTPGEAKTAGFVFGMMFVLLYLFHTLWGAIWWVSPTMQNYFTRKQMP